MLKFGFILNQSNHGTKMNILADPTKRGRGCYKHSSNLCFLEEIFKHMQLFERVDLLVSKMNFYNQCCRGSHQAEQNQQEFVSVQCFHFCLAAFRFDSSVVPSLRAA